MTDCLLSGESVKLTSFGTFETRKRADRLGRNPKTGNSSYSRSSGYCVQAV
ncbi:MAG: HU family DNA-binding protein [Nitrospirota bacterium]|nr:HU family DNA-binding protein [Nitrospirota bacterium]